MKKISIFPLHSALLTPLSLYIVSTVNDKLQKEMTITLAEKENQFQQQVIIVVFYFLFYYVYRNVTQNSLNR
jgi:hypothetical protein